MNDFDFSQEDSFNETQIAFEEMAKLMATQFKAFKKAGLSTVDSAALVAQYWAAQANLGTPTEAPEDGTG